MVIRPLGSFQQAHFTLHLCRRRGDKDLNLTAHVGRVLTKYMATHTSQVLTPETVPQKCCTSGATPSHPGLYLLLSLVTLLEVLVLDLRLEGELITVLL